MLPNLFVVGAMKCGTTTVFKLLSATPTVAMYANKETNHFSLDLLKTTNESSWGWVQDRQAYLSAFPEADVRWMGEASPAYLYSPSAAENIFRFNPDAHIVVVLRNPIKRAYSEYLWNQRRGRNVASFSQVIREDYERVRSGQVRMFSTYVTAGMYASQVERFARFFPRKQIMVEIVDRPGVGFSRLCDRLSMFLDVAVPPLPSADDGIANGGQLPIYPILNRLLFRAGIKDRVTHLIPMPIKAVLKRGYYRTPAARIIQEEDWSFLRDAFADDIARLGQSIGEDLRYWLDPPSDAATSREA